MTIAELAAWSKRTIGNKAVPALILLTATGSFGLGMLAEKGGEGHAPGDQLWIENLPQEEVATPKANAADSATLSITNKLYKPSAVKTNVTPAPAGGEVIASKSGHSYYLSWCGMVKRIKESNKVTFASRGEAEKAGYAPAKHCKGL